MIGKVQARNAQIILEGNESEEIQCAAVSESLRIAKRLKVPVDKKLRAWICRHCNSPAIPGRNARIRIRKGIRIRTCGCCNRIHRFPLRGRGHVDGS